MITAGDGHCPVCRAALAAPAAAVLEPVKCPRCEAELWVLVGTGDPIFLCRKPGQSANSFLAVLAAPSQGISAAEIERLLEGCDSFDYLEFVVEVEEAIRSGCC
jgi:hypothetical protein